MQWWKTVKISIKKIKEKLNMKWVIFVNNMVCPLLPLLGKNRKNMTKVTKINAIKNIKNTEITLLNRKIIIRRNMFLKNMLNRDQVKVNVLTMVNLGTSAKTVRKNLVS